MIDTLGNRFVPFFTCANGLPHELLKTEKMRQTLALCAAHIISMLIPLVMYVNVIRTTVLSRGMTRGLFPPEPE